MKRRIRSFELVTGEDWCDHRRPLLAFGMTEAQAIDYRAIEKTDITQADWADMIGVSQPAVSISLKGAKEKLHSIVTLPRDVGPLDP